MKKDILWIVMLIYLFFACSKNDDGDLPILQPNDSTITIESTILVNGIVFDAIGGEKSLSFTTDADWELSIASTRSGISWCTSSAISGNKGTSTVKFTTTENTDYEDRRVAVTIKAGSASKTFTITQKSAEGLLVSANKFEIPKEGGTIDIEVKANIDYQMEISESAMSWIRQSDTRALTSQKYIFTIEPSKEYDKREGEIIIKSNDKTETITVYQTGGPILLLSQKEYVVSDQSTTLTVDIKSNFEYGVQMPAVDWVTEEPASKALSSHTLKYYIASNESYDDRTAQIIYYDKNSTLKDTLLITQSGSRQMISLSDNLLMHPKNIALQYTGIKDFYTFFDCEYDEMICKEIYTKFEDVFDFIIFLYNTSEEDFLYGGFSYPTNLDISGIGKEQVSTYSRFGSNGQLKGIKHLTSRTSIFSAGPFLHELAHHWGGAFIGQEYATPNGTYEIGMHWGTSDINGILGGFDYATLERNVDGEPNKYYATCSRAKSWGFRGFSQELSNGYYAPLELYLMGLLPADSVPDMHIFKKVRVENDTWGDGVFYAESEITYTMDDFIAEYGKREPDYRTSQKDFRALVVVITDEPVSDKDWELIESDILKQEKQGIINDEKQTNFWEATGGRATLSISGIDQFLKK